MRGACWCIAAAFALASLSLLLPWATTYDPWAWIVWGREVAHLDLRTVGGPSWKPLPVLFTAPFALAGSAAPALWLIVARTGGLLALAAAHSAGRRLGGPIAAVAASVALLLNLEVFRVVWLGSSEGILIAALLAALERHVAGKPRVAFGLGVVCALLRPETWPFIALYGLWLVWRDRPAWRLVSGAGAGVAFLWLAPELWGSGQLWRSADRALQPVATAAAFAPDPAMAVVERAHAMLLGPVPAAALIACAFALAGWRRREGDRALSGAATRRAVPRAGTDRAVLGAAMVAAAWIALVASMTAHGFSGNSRYVMAPVALICVLAGVGVARVAQVLHLLIARARLAPTVTTALAAGLLAAGLVPFTFHNARLLGRQAAVLEYQARMRAGLKAAVTRAGGPAAVRKCGQAVTEDYSVPMLAWYLGVHADAVGLRPPARGIVFQARPGPLSPLDPRLGRWRAARHFSSGPYNVYLRCASPTLHSRVITR